MPTGNPQSGQIYLLREPLPRSSKHPHPVLVIRVDGPVATVNFMSSELSLRRDGKDFTIDESEPDFSKTGLEKASYLVADGGALEVPVSSLDELWGTIPAGRLRDRLSEW